MVYDRSKHDFLPKDLLRINKKLNRKSVGFWLISDDKTLFQVAIESIGTAEICMEALAERGARSIVRAIVRMLLAIVGKTDYDVEIQAPGNIVITEGTEEPS